MVLRQFMNAVALVVSLVVSCPQAHGAENFVPVAPGLRAQPLRGGMQPLRQESTRFVPLTSAQTGIDLVNRLDWGHAAGLLFDTGYACGGIAVGDIDGNGLPDLFCVSGLGRNRLYFQQSPWQFIEGAVAAGLPGDEQQPLGGDGWGTGGALFDIDNDGDLDLYVCNYAAPNALYINRGDGTFNERAADYGLDIVDASLMPSVADYDRDGDLDIYLAINRYLEEKKFGRRDLFYWRDGREHLRPAAEKYFVMRRHFDRAEQLNMWAGRKDRLLRNEGAGKKFTDISEELGLERGDTLSATWWDYDHDGWPDLYLAHDLAAPDRLLRNQGNGSFEDVTLQSLPHTPWLAMGSSAGDINNDGLVDLLVADMSFRTHFKDKASMGDMSAKFRTSSFFPHVQLMRNSLFVNSGTAHFQEAAHLAGLASTDWTWSAMLADLDNDGRLDAYFTNGTPVNLAGSSEFAASQSEVADGEIDTSIIRSRYRESAPVLEQNLAYQNQGDLQFADRSRAWGLDHVGMSFAAVHADLDRDGDLDLVVANLEEPLSVYRNDSPLPGVLVQLMGKSSNRFGVGAEVIVETEVSRQLRQIYPVAGFQSCQEATVHFGLGKATTIHRLTVRWPSGIEQIFENLAVGQHFQVEEPIAAEGSPRAKHLAYPASEAGHVAPWFALLPSALVAEHHEEPFDDFAIQPLLPSKLSQLGPPLAWGDVDGDGDDDLFLGEGRDWMGMLYINEGHWKFTPQPQVALARDAAAEDRAAVFLDANQDGHLDLYVGSGSVEFASGSKQLGDRLYLGNGAGEFERASDDWLPDLRSSTGAIATADFDRDGDTDLVVGTRSIPGEYPLTPKHALLRNAGDHYEEVLADLAPELAQAGMITAVAWADVNGDGWSDLLAATDWGPVRLYLNRNGKLVEQTQHAGLDQWTGWWQSLACADLDQDGDIDFIAGNFGRNTKYQASPDHPVLAYYGEYGDASGRRNLIEASYEGEVLFPLRGKSCSSAAMPHLSQRYKTYEAFAKATLAEIYTPACLQQAERFEVNTLASACFLNDGEGHFSRRDLPTAVQLAPVFAIAVTEVNGDGRPDLFLAQNFFGPQRETGPLAGGLGVVAIGQGDGTFDAVRPDRAGVAVAGDAKAVAAVDLDGDGWRDLCIATNDGPLQLFRRRRAAIPAASQGTSVATSSWVTRDVALARQFLDSQQNEQSFPYLRRALKVAPQNSDALLLLASVRRDQGRFSAAQQLLDRVRGQGNLDAALLLVEQGQLSLSMQQYDRAVEALLQALAIRPEDHLAHQVLGEVRLQQGRLREAREHFQVSRRSDWLAKADQQAAAARLLYEQGVAAKSKGEEVEAIRLLEKSRRLNAQQETLKELALLLETASDLQLRDPWLAEQLRIWSKEQPLP